MSDEPVNGTPPAGAAAPGSLRDFLVVCGFSDNEIATLVAMRPTHADVLTTVVSRLAMRLGESEARVRQLEDWAMQVSGGERKDANAPRILVPGGRGWRN